MQGLMAEATDRYTATRLSVELGLDNRKMRDILTRVNPVQVKGRSKLYLLRDVIPHAAKYLGAPDVIDLNVERARKVKAEAELAEIELAKEREDLIQVEAIGQVVDQLAVHTRLLHQSERFARDLFGCPQLRQLGRARLDDRPDERDHRVGRLLLHGPKTLERYLASWAKGYLSLSNQEGAQVILVAKPRLPLGDELCRDSLLRYHHRQ